MTGGAKSKQFNFPVGVHELHNDTSLDFQLNRLATLGGGNLAEVSAVALRIETLKDWKREFLTLAKRAEAEGRTTNAAAYLRAAEFFMSHTDPDRAPTYAHQAELFRTSIADELASGETVVSEAKFGLSRLPVLTCKPRGRKTSKGTVLIHGGFDSYIEELYPFVRAIAECGYEAVVFEGPGQGAVIRRQDLPFTTEWEKPVGAVLDHIGAHDVTLIGISLGGFLAPRAAAFESRIKRVVAFDVCWDMFDAVMSMRPAPIRLAMQGLLLSGASTVLDVLIQRQMTMDPFTRWVFEHGCYVFGIERPSEYLLGMKHFTTRDISEKIRQDFLLLAGAEDHYMPLDHYHAQARALTNVRSFTGRVFTRAEQGHTHCQCGNLNVALTTMVNWIAERSESAANGS